MKKLNLLIGCFILSCGLLAQSQTTVTQEEIDVLESYVVETKTIPEMQAAQQQGAIVFKYKDRYFVKLRDKYESVRDLATAVRLRKDNKLPLPSKAGTKADLDSGYGMAYNPQLMLFPFTNLNEDNSLSFELPNEETIAAQQVMIHPGPYVFDDVSFAPIDLFQSLKSFQASGNPNAPSPNAMPENLRNVKHFAVTGQFSPQANVEVNHQQLEYWVGGAVVNTNGDVLWKLYSEAESDNGFKLVKAIDRTSSNPEFLLMFILAKGKLPEMLRSAPGIEPMDATPYEYHVLGSVAIEVGQNWFPPVNEATQEEYNAMMQDLQNNQMESNRQNN